MYLRSVGQSVDTAFHSSYAPPYGKRWLLVPVGLEEHSGNTGEIPGRPRRCNQISELMYFNCLGWPTIMTIAITILDCEKVLSKHV